MISIRLSENSRLLSQTVLTDENKNKKERRGDDDASKELTFGAPCAFQGAAGREVVLVRTRTEATNRQTGKQETRTKRGDLCCALAMRSEGD